MLDGLDEVSDPTWRRKIMEAVRRFLKEWCSLQPVSEGDSNVSDQMNLTERFGNQVVITSRPVGYQFDPLVDLPHYTLEEMDEQAIKVFCRTWMQHAAHPPVSAEEASRWAQQLYDAIFSNAHPGVRSMAGNPLLLTIMAKLAWKTRTPNGIFILPARRVSLFEEATRLFYDQREAFWDQAGITLHAAITAMRRYIPLNLFIRPPVCWCLLISMKVKCLPLPLPTTKDTFVYTHVCCPS